GGCLRGALTLLCARAVTADRPETSEQTIAAAVAAELVHDAEMLRADVAEGVLVRRHRSSAWAAHGMGPTLAAADLALAEALARLSGPSLAFMADALRVHSQGRAHEHQALTGTAPNLDHALRVAEQRSGALSAAACRLGALSAGADELAVELFASFGRHLGVALQLAGDVDGIWGDPRLTGRTAGWDLLVCRRSLPVVAALASGTAEGTELADLYGRSKVLDTVDVQRAQRLLEASGARRWAVREARRRVDAALRSLAWTEPAPAGAMELGMVATLGWLSDEQPDPRP
ncbi:polyprenyl synthetase family protein, partial [Actinocorallia lasiicapitis]